MTLDTQMTLALLQELLMALRDNDADGYKSWLVLGIEELGRDVAAEASRKQEAEERAEAAAVEAKFKAEGWWEQEPGIFVRWCEDSNCPGRASDHYSDYVWRAMVYCRDRACGDIYARLNILQDDIVVGWTNETAYGGRGQKVVLTFGSSTQGSGRIVEFTARG